MPPNNDDTPTDQISKTGWEGILDEDETILWQGQPKPGIDWIKLLHFQTLFGIFFTGFAVFWIMTAFEMTGGMRGGPSIFKVFPLFGLIFVAAGLNMVIGRHLWAALTRSSTYYTLTDKAAYIATNTLGRRKLTRWTFAEMGAVSLIDTTYGSVMFAEKRMASGNVRPSSTALRTPVGFERIEDARQVHRMLETAKARRKSD